MKRTDFIAPLFVMLAIAGLGYLFFLAPPAKDTTFAPVELPGSTLATVPGISSATAYVFEATLVEDGFITIHQSIGGAPGPIIAASALLLPGTYENIPVALATALVPGSDYVALLHVDNGDGAYIVNDDLPVKANGATVRADFRAGETETTE